jgi:hypothetical protein
MARRITIWVCVALLAMPPVEPTAWGQQQTPPAAPVAAPPESKEATPFSPQQLDALLAPIALYPDTLLTQLLIASTYPLEVVDAARWVQDPANAELKGDALVNALKSKIWDPSVKSLVPFPSVLEMMNGQLDWLQQLGYAFSEQQADVLNSIQRLRRQAQEAGTLKTNEQQVVRVEQAAVTDQAAPPQTIIIEPANPQVVYVPSYNPTVAYGGWPYPAYPPVYMPPPPGYVAGNALLSGLAFGTGVAITAGLWGLAGANWGHGDVNVNVNRWNNVSTNRQAVRNSTWQPSRAAGGNVRPPGGPVGRPQRSQGLPANAVGRSNVKVPSNLVRPPGGSAGAGQGLRTNPAAQNRAAGGGVNQGQRRANTAGATGARRPQAASRPAARQTSRQAPAFSGMNQGRQASQFGARGGQSRSSQAQRPAGGGRGGGGRAAPRRR